MRSELEESGLGDKEDESTMDALDDLLDTQPQDRRNSSMIKDSDPVTTDLIVNNLMNQGFTNAFLGKFDEASQLFR